LIVYLLARKSINSSRLKPASLNKDIECLLAGRDYDRETALRREVGWEKTKWLPEV
jgi:uncharacterized protein YllA (UPF0747 family)